MRVLRPLAIGMLVVFVAGGCAMRERRWGACAVGGAIIGGVAGGTAGGVAVNNAKDHASDGERAAGIVGGGAAGALLGALLGHAICDPMIETPPPAPAAAAPPPPPPPSKPLVTLHGPQFDFDKATLKPEGKKMVDEAVRVMKENPTMHVSVEGHTDSIGSEAYNQRLSERRANSVRDYMVSQGIDAGHITTVGYGKTKPIADNKTAEGRAENRRVEIIPS